MKKAAPVLAPEVDIVRESEHWDTLADLDGLTQAAIAAALAEADRTPMPGAELCVVFADDTAIRRLNAEWRGMDKPTNVLSFPAVPPEAIGSAPMLGDIVLAYETIAREASEEGRTLSHHTTHLIVHGLLHLMGYDHLTDADAEDMEAREIRALAALGIDNPYADLPYADPATTRTAG